jgi:CHC2 zinc finger
MTSPDFSTPSSSVDAPREAALPSQRLVGELDEAVQNRSGRREGQEIRFLCPSHDDRNPSARWNREKAVWHCDACGAGGGAFHLAERLGIQVPDAFPRLDHTTVYAIRDAAGHTVAEHIRIDRPDGGKRFLWKRDGRKGLAGMRASELPLYGAHRAAAYDPARPIFLVEGEKAAERLCAIGIQAVASVTGAMSIPRPSSLEVLRDRQVVLWPDADDPGARHMEGVAEALRGLAAGIQVFASPGLPEGGDAAEWIDQRRTEGKSEDLIRQELEAAAGEAPSAMPPPAAREPVTGRRASVWASAVSAPVFLTTEAEEPNFLEPRLIAPGCLTEWFSPRGLGKTHVAHALAVKLARNGSRVLLLDRDNGAREVRRRLRGWGWCSRRRRREQRGRCVGFRTRRSGCGSGLASSTSRPMASAHGSNADG